MFYYLICVGWSVTRQSTQPAAHQILSMFRHFSFWNLPLANLKDNLLIQSGEHNSNLYAPQPQQQQSSPNNGVQPVYEKLRSIVSCSYLSYFYFISFLCFQCNGMLHMFTHSLYYSIYHYYTLYKRICLCKILSDKIKYE